MFQGEREREEIVWENRTKTTIKMMNFNLRISFLVSGMRERERGIKKEPFCLS